MDLKFSVVFDEAQFAEFVHEKAHARPGRADHLRQRFLTKISHDRLRLAFLAEICKQKEKPRKPMRSSISLSMPEERKQKAVEIACEASQRSISADVKIF
jgi:hypothetical protein